MAIPPVWPLVLLAVVSLRVSCGAGHIRSGIETRCSFDRVFHGNTSSVLLQTAATSRSTNAFLRDEQPSPKGELAWQARDGHKHLTAASQTRVHQSEEPERRVYLAVVAALAFLAVTSALQLKQQRLLLEEAGDGSGGTVRSHLLDNARLMGSTSVIFGHFTGCATSLYCCADTETWLKNGQTEARLVKELFPLSMPVICFVSGLCSQGHPTRRRVKSFLLGLVLPSILWTFPMARLCNYLLEEPMKLTKWPEDGLLEFVFIEWYLPALVTWRCLAFLFFHRLHPVVLLLLAQAASCAGGYCNFGAASWDGTLLTVGSTCGFLPYFVAGYVCNFQLWCKKIPAVGWPWRVAAYGVMTAIGLVWHKVITETNPHFWFAANSSSVDGFSWAFRVTRWGVEMVQAAIWVFVCLPRDETCLTWLGQHTLYPYLLHHMLWLEQRNKLVEHLPLPVLTSTWAHYAVLLGHLPFTLLGQVFMSSWPVRWVLQPIFKPMYLEPAVDLLVGTSK